MWFPILAGALLALMIGWQFQQLAKARKSADHSQEIVLQIFQTEQTLLDMESAVRGFATSKDSDYLASFQLSQTEYKPHLDRLRELSQSHRSLDARLKNIERLSAEWLMIAQSQVSAGMRASPRARSPKDSERGISLLKAVRDELTGMLADENQRRAERVQYSRRTTRLLLDGTTGFALLLGVLFALLARRQLFSLAYAYQEAWNDRSKFIESERRRASQLEKIAQSAVTMNAAIDPEFRLQVVTDQARLILGATRAIAVVRREGNGEREGSGDVLLQVASYADPSRLGATPSVDREALEWTRQTNRTSRRARSLAAPLIGLDGMNIGMIQLFDKAEGEFTTEDETVLVQLAQIASVSMENAKLLSREREAVRSRDAFLSMASHELKTPLTSLKLQVQMSQRAIGRDGADGGGGDRVGRFLGQMDRSVERLAKLVEDMLDISRISAGKLSLHLEECDLSLLVQEVTDRLQSWVQSYRCTIRYAGVSALVGTWDRFRLEQVLTNLVTNAAKYGPNGVIDVRLEDLGSAARIVVTDHGQGIAPEDQQRIFERFERAGNPSDVSGLGLGLYISKSIVEMHGGSIELQSELGRGSTFAVRLPKQAAIRETSAGAGAPFMQP